MRVHVDPARGDEQPIRIDLPVRRLTDASFRGCAKRVVRGVQFKPPKTTGIGGGPTTSIYEVKFYFGTSYYEQARAPVCEFSAF